jgi:hypothetical protein
MIPPVIEMDSDPAVALTLPPVQVVLAFGVGAITTPLMIG